MNDTKSRDRAFSEMRKAALARLQGKEAESVAQNTGIAYDREQQLFTLESLGKNIQVRFPQYEITPDLDSWHHLLLLHYMDLADKTPLSDQLMTFGELPGGMVRGGGFDRESERILSMQLGNCSPNLVRKACEVLGAEIIESNADLSGVFYIFPFYPITLKLWFADDEISGSGKLLLNKSAEHFLSVEDAVTAGSLLLEVLLKKYKEVCL